MKSRVLEERLIKIYKSGLGYFWIGGPGEEGFGVPLGLLVKKGQGLDHDWLYLHYRCSGTVMALGESMEDSFRLLMNRKSDPYTGGRNFCGHYCCPQYNLTPVTSTIETQYSQCIGTAWVQKREKSKGITIVTGGDAGTAEGDFATCLIWSSRKGNELPLLITVQNNRWGISTPFDTQHGEKNIADRAKAFGIKSCVMNGNDPEESYKVLKESMDYVRKKRKPFLLEVQVSRLYGHSSASGANFVSEEDVLEKFEKKLLKKGVLKKDQVQAVWKKYLKEADEAFEKVQKEEGPSGDTVWDHVYANNENADWRKF